jgi:peroxiredoxin
MHNHYDKAPEIIENMVASNGKSVQAMAEIQPVMLIFLRHFGCNFCREGLAQIALKRQEIEDNGVTIVFVHMAEAKKAKPFFEKFKLPKAIHISDPDKIYYRAFGLSKGTFTQLFGLNTWGTGFRTLAKHGADFRDDIGDSFQMPGIFLISEGEIKDSFLHKDVADVPDYGRLMQCCNLA